MTGAARLDFDQVVEAARAASRAPSVAACALSAGEVVWSTPNADAQYRIGSITKTFVATEVMRLRDEGRLDLADPIGRHLPELGFGHVTIAQLLSHTSGLQAETSGAWWERSPGISWTQLVASGPRLALAPGTRFHYSNTGFAVLGELVARARGMSWFEAISSGILRPLGMARTTERPQQPAAVGYAVHPSRDLLLAEPEYDAGAMAPAGQLWSTVTDLAAWARFLTGDTGGVLARSTLDEMCVPLAVATPPGSPFGSAQGLGWHVDAGEDGRWFAGHGGSMPGFLAQLWAEQASGKAVVTLANTTSGFSVVDELWEALDVRYPSGRQADAPPPAAVPSDVAALLGTWYWGPAPFTLTATADGFRLGDAQDQRWSRFARDGDGWRGLDTYFAGERLAIRADGSLDLASFTLTREPYPGGDWRPRPEQ